MELCSMLCGSLNERGVWGRMDTCICMAESLHHSPETITALLIGYTPIQNLKKLFKAAFRSSFNGVVKEECNCLDELLEGKQGVGLLFSRI